MNALTSLFSTTLPRPRNRSQSLPLVTRTARRERDFGVGYGSSSGYAAAPRYASSWTAPRFRFI